MWEISSEVLDVNINGWSQTHSGLSGASRGAAPVCLRVYTDVCERHSRPRVVGRCLRLSVLHLSANSVQLRHPIT